MLRPAAESRPIIIHTLAQANAALDAAKSLNKPIALQSAPNALLYAGSLYLLHLFQEAERSHHDAQASYILDSSEAIAETIAAMHDGHRLIRTNAPEPWLTKIRDIASQLEVFLLPPVKAALDLGKTSDYHAACLGWLDVATSH
jgi:hypothetical protein